MKTVLNVILLGIVCIVFIGFAYLLKKDQDKIESQFPDRKKSEIAPVVKDTTTKTLELMGKYKLASGHLYVYKLGKDTVYLVEGANQNYPVSITVR